MANKYFISTMEEGFFDFQNMSSFLHIYELLKRYDHTHRHFIMTTRN